MGLRSTAPNGVGLQRASRVFLAISLLLSPTSALLSWDCGPHDPDEEEWPSTAVEDFLVLLASYAYIWMTVIGVMFLVCGVLLCFKVPNKDAEKEKEKSDARTFIFLCTSYCGLVYLIYPVTVIVAGTPQDNWVYPELPHLGPAEPDSNKKVIFAKFVLNGVSLFTFPIWMAYLLMFVAGLVSTFVVSAVVLGLVIVVARLADYIDDVIQEGAMVGPTATAATGGGKGKTADTGGAGGGASSGAAAGGLPSGGGAASGCASCCRGMFVAVYCIGRALKTVFNLFFDLLLLISVSWTWPSLGMPQVDFEIGYGLDFDIPCIRMPRVRFNCRFLSTAFQVAMLACMTVPIFVIISSDLMVLLNDRILRAASSSLSLTDKDQRWKALRNLVLSQIIAQCQFICWKVVEIIAANGAAAFVEVFFHVFEMDSSTSCHPALNVAAKILAISFALMVCARIVAMSVGRGLYSEMVYIMAVALTESDIPIFTKARLISLVSMVRITIGSMLFPFKWAKLGLNHLEVSEIKRQLDKYDQGDTFDLKAANNDFNEMIASEKARSHWIPEMLLSWRKAFSAEVSMLAALWENRRHDEVKHENMKVKLVAGVHVDIVDVGATSIDDFLDGQRYAKKLRKDLGKSMKNTVCMPFNMMIGRYTERELAQLRALGRSQLWQAQIEAVQRASGNAFGVCLQMIPFVGVFIGKATMYLNEYPTWIRVEDAEFGTRSLRWKRHGVATEDGYPDNNDGILEGSVRLKKLYFCSVLKVALLFIAYFTNRALICMAAAFVVGLTEIYISRSEEPEQMERHTRKVIKIAARKSAIVRAAEASPACPDDIERPSDVKPFDHPALPGGVPGPA